MCTGTTDVPLSTPGRLQACIAGEYLRVQGLSAVYSSPLLRAVSTAEQISSKYTVVDDLCEAYAGDWEGLAFSRIREEWPELYRMRGEDANLPIPGAESISDCEKRFSRAVNNILSESCGDIVIVSHITAIQSYLCSCLGVPLSRCRSISLPHGSVSVLETGDEPAVTAAGTVPAVPLSDALCALLMKASGVGDEAAAHCRKVAEKALHITDALNRAGCRLDTDVIEYASLLHDIARRERDHAAAGGKWLELLGYYEIGKTVSRHHDILPVELSEAAVLSIADRCISGTEEVSIDERFLKSSAKCTDAASAAAHKARYENAKALRSLINGICGTEVVD